MNDLKTTSVLQKLYKNSTREGQIIQLLCNIIPPTMILYIVKKVIQLQNWWQKITSSAAKHPLLSRYLPSKFETFPSKADDVICELPLLPKLSTKTGRNQKI